MKKEVNYELLKRLDGRVNWGNEDRNKGLKDFFEKVGIQFDPDTKPYHIRMLPDQDGIRIEIYRFAKECTAECIRDAYKNKKTRSIFVVLDSGIGERILDVIDFEPHISTEDLREYLK